MFTLGPSSTAALTGVHPAIVRVVLRAIAITDQNFMVFEGLRTIAHEQVCIAEGVSKLKNPADCKHCPQPDGFGHAVDLVPLVGGQPKWLWPAIYPMAEAMRISAIAENVGLRWGGVWDKRLNDLQDIDKLKAAVADYCARHSGPDFLDGPHFELV